MKFFFLVFVFYFLTNWCFCLEYGREAQYNCLNTKIEKFAIFSERYSGSNYLEPLINENFPELIHENKYGHKHYSPWFDNLESFSGPTSLYTFDNNENTLFLILFRDPYDWLRSFHQFPFHAAFHFYHCNFSQFIRMPWELDPYDDGMNQLRRIYPLAEKNPKTGDAFDNVIQLRTAKIRNMLEITTKVDNFYIINYETLRDKPEQVLNEIAELFHLKQKEHFTPIISYRGDVSAGIYQQKSYERISQFDLEFINEQLDEDLENQIGYSLWDDH